MKSLLSVLLALFIFFLPNISEAKSKENKKKDSFNSSVFAGLKFRAIGPSFTSGRIADFAVNPKNHSEYYVAVASGNIWKTINAGITFKPVFDKYGSYSIGSLAIDPTNTNVIWAGTGENNHQRALGYGDGIYKSLDGGKTWKNMGLKNSRHIGKILINSKNSNIVYVAAEGSTWGSGGDRGLYKTIDGGKTWKRVLKISENTGISSMVMDPRDCNVIYAGAEQRRRHVFTKIGGGPESALYKTVDGGKTWKKLKSGIPSGDKGGIGLAISPVNPDYIYAIIEGTKDTKGFYRSTDRGESWKKMSSHSSSGQYYNEIFCDPKDVNKVFSMETVSKYTLDGGKTWRTFGLTKRHVDDHALWIDPTNTKHILIGCDGGMYETYDMGKHFNHMTNLPVIQFYRVAVDNSFPFYHVFGGTQDNGSMGGPSNSLSRRGVKNSDWYLTNGGDGFWTTVDPKDSNTVYAESQYGNIVRYNKKNKESKYIRPQPRKGEKTYKWNWDTPYLISPHSNTRLYIAANKVFRSDDRGNSWKVISDDITAKIDRNTWKVMNKYWSSDAVAKDVSTSQFGTAVAIDESRLQENLLYIGTDDGLIQVTENIGKTWRKISKFPGVPQYTYISDIFTSRFDKNTVFVSFDNMKRDDFKPYLLKSTDKGKTWISIASNLPENGTVHTIVQDFKNKNLLFAGTEFGVFFSINGGKKWIQLKSGIPTIAVKDITIQERENDLVLATFGRGFYILDNYSPLREFNKKILKEDIHLFSIKDALLYVQTGGRYGSGENLWHSKNPEYGAVFTYYVGKIDKTAKEIRQKKEKALFKKGEKINVLNWNQLREESIEEAPYLIFTITDTNGNIVRELRTKEKKGMNRIVWNLKYTKLNPVKNSPSPIKYNPLKKAKGSFLVMPGKYQVYISKNIHGKRLKLTKPISFSVKALNMNSMSSEDFKKIDNFNKELIKMSKDLQGTIEYTNSLLDNIITIKQTILLKPKTEQQLYPKLRKLELQLRNIQFKFNGHKAKASAEEIPPSHVPIMRRFETIIYTRMGTTSKPAQNMINSLNIAKDELKKITRELKSISEKITKINEILTKKDLPWTQGRLPRVQ